ncbi:transglutaminase-like cysteine peptidase [Phenylobacterium sp.]|uniref:transglutaminase-like cysteine peptidase n=1 Tax=Phenylobacterium sp. TaxID=1871053 RepID=UPI002FE1E9A6
MSYFNTLAQRALVVGLGFSAAACATLPEPSAPMTLGAAATAPRGFVEFCGRQPGDCGASPAELGAMSRAAPKGAPTSVAAIQFDWSGVFGTTAPAPKAVIPVATAPAPSGDAAFSFDWTQVFARQLQAPVATSAADAAEPAVAVAEPMPAAEKLPLTPSLWSLVTRTNETVNRAIVQRTDAQAYGVEEIWSTPLQAGVQVGDCEDYVLEKRRALLAAGLPKEALSIAVVTTSKGQSHAVLLVDTAAGEYVLDNLSPWVLPWTKTSYQWRERQVAGSAARWAFAAGPVLETSAPRLLLASLR